MLEADLDTRTCVKCNLLTVATMFRKVEMYQKRMEAVRGWVQPYLGLPCWSERGQEWILLDLSFIGWKPPRDKCKFPGNLGIHESQAGSHSQEDPSGKRLRHSLLGVSVLKNVQGSQGYGKNTGSICYMAQSRNQVIFSLTCHCPLMFCNQEVILTYFHSYCPQCRHPSLSCFTLLIQILLPTCL